MFRLDLSNPDDPPSTLLLVKAVPGASRNAIAGPLGDRLKVRIAAPPEGGKANRAICRLIADACSLRAADVEVIAGHASPEKTLRIRGVTPEQAAALLT